AVNTSDSDVQDQQTSRYPMPPTSRTRESAPIKPTTPSTDAITAPSPQRSRGDASGRRAVRMGKADGDRQRVGGVVGPRQDGQAQHDLDHTLDLDLLRSV